MGVLKRVPVLGKDLLEDTPVPRGCCSHQVAPSWGDKIVAVKRFYHGLPASSTPHRPVHGHPHPPLSSLINGCFRDRENEFSYTIKQAVPGLTRVAVLRGPARQTFELQAMEGAAPSLGVELHLFEVPEPPAFDSAFAAMTNAQVQALFVLGDPTYARYSQRIADFAAQQHLPSICVGRAYVEAGCLMSYGASEQGRGQQIAAYVDKILHGTKPADLPVEQPMKFALVINLKTAQALGITIPPMLLFQADEVLK